MANHKSALKRIKQTQKKNLRNRILKSKYRTELKKFFSIQDDKKEITPQKVSFIHSIIDKAKSKKIISKNAAARKKSKIALSFKKIA